MKYLKKKLVKIVRPCHYSISMLYCTCIQEKLYHALSLLPQFWVIFGFTDVQSTPNCHLSVLWTLFLVTVARNWTAPTWFLLAPPPHLSPLNHPASGAKTPCLPVNPTDSRPVLLHTFLGQRETVQTTAISVVCFGLGLLFIWFLVILFCYVHDTILMKVFVFIPWFDFATIKDYILLVIIS